MGTQLGVPRHGVQNGTTGVERLCKKERLAAGKQPESLLASNPYLPGQEKAQPETKAEHDRACEVGVILASCGWRRKKIESGGGKTSCAPGV